jgi:hypothetical protein
VTVKVVNRKAHRFLTIAMTSFVSADSALHIAEVNTAGMNDVRPILSHVDSSSASFAG